MDTMKNTQKSALLSQNAVAGPFEVRHFPESPNTSVFQSPRSSADSSATVPSPPSGHAPATNASSHRPGCPADGARSLSGPGTVSHSMPRQAITGASSDGSSPDFRETRRQLKQRIIAAFHSLLAVNDSGRKWQGTMTDLMELTHEAWLAERYLDRTGRPLAFKVMARHVCRVLHCRVVPNPYTFVEKSRTRKGTLIEPILDRYTRLVIQYRLQNPMLMEMPLRKRL